MKNCKKIVAYLACAICIASAYGMNADTTSVKLKDISRVDGIRQNSLVGYGLVVGLAGSGDSPQNKLTKQTITNVLSNFGLTVDESDINSRNVAAVSVTAQLSPFGSEGSSVDVNVASIGDARSLAGGTLLMAALKGADNVIHVIAQGPISVGGFKYDMNGNMVQKNHPTVGIVPNGGVIEKPIDTAFVDGHNEINILLDNPGFDSARVVESSINNSLSGQYAMAVHPGKIKVKVPPGVSPVTLIAQLDGIAVALPNEARIVINERTGTIVSGGNIKIDPVTISHGSLKVEITTQYSVSQPMFNRGIIPDSVSTVVVPDTQINANDDVSASVSLPAETSVNDLITALEKVHASTRDIIVILQSMKQAGALHAELIIQ